MSNAVDVSFLNDIFDQTDQSQNVQNVQDRSYLVDVIHFKMTESKKNKSLQLM